MTRSLFTAVTVSIPERHELLARAGASLRAQTYGPVPWIVRVEEPDRFGCEHVARQRNAILPAVQTEWIAVLDDDDTFDPEYLEVMARHVEGVDVVYSYCRGHAHSWGEFDAERLRSGDNYIDGEACIRTEALREAGGYPVNDVVEDWQLWLRFLDMGKRFVCVPQELRTHGRAQRNVTC
jgi:hypothetical protein